MYVLTFHAYGDPTEIIGVFSSVDTARAQLPAGKDFIQHAATRWTFQDGWGAYILHEVTLDQPVY